MSLLRRAAWLALLGLGLVVSPSLAATTLSLEVSGIEAVSVRPDCSTQVDVGFFVTHDLNDGVALFGPEIDPASVNDETFRVDGKAATTYGSTTVYRNATPYFVGSAIVSEPMRAGNHRVWIKGGPDGVRFKAYDYYTNESVVAYLASDWSGTFRITPRQCRSVNRTRFLGQLPRLVDHAAPAVRARA